MALREAAKMPEFPLFVQGAYWLPIRELARKKMKSELRNNYKKEIGTLPMLIP